MLRKKDTKQIELFEFEHSFEGDLEPENRWVKLSKILPWEEMVSIYGKSLSKDKGRYGIDWHLAGSLFLIKDKIDTTFFVSNCDIIINEDYSGILKYHRENKNELTIVSALKHYPIPYGTVKTKEKGILFELKEKPELTFQINSGMYILEPHLLNEIPENKFFHITQLIKNIQKRKGRVGVFPISQRSWKDLGQMDDYIKLLSNQFGNNP